VFDYYRRGYSTVHVRDIRNALLAIHAASSRAMRFSESRESEVFQEGFTAALEAVATAFGLDPLFSGIERTRVPLPAIVDVTPGSANLHGRGPR
jgi:hypothetical protein